MMMKRKGVVGHGKDTVQWNWYAQQTIEKGWSLNILVNQIESDLYRRQRSTRKSPILRRRCLLCRAELVLQTIKDPYISAVDGILKTEQDNSSIGLLLCNNYLKNTRRYCFPLTIYATASANKWGK
jgi:hypothetical protein